MKRTPLRRTASLSAKSRLRRGKPLARRSREQARRDARWATVRVTVLERDGGMCRHCGGVGHDVHHMAGRVGGDMFALDLLITLCRTCHDRATVNPAWAREQGLSVRRLRGVA